MTRRILLSVSARMWFAPFLVEGDRAAGTWRSTREKMGWLEVGEMWKNCAILHNILQLKKGKEAGANTTGAGQS